LMNSAVIPAARDVCATSSVTISAYAPDRGFVYDVIR
jgi:hypothetical protein